MTDIAKVLFNSYIVPRIIEESVIEPLGSVIQTLDEALTPDQKNEVDKWERGDNSFSDHAYADSPDPDRVSIPLEHPGVSSPHQKDVQSHLEKHGFKVKDYVAGKAEDKYGRETNIGRALARTKADQDVIKKFNEDPARARSKTGTSGLKVVVSRHPHDVAGMTSSGQPWEKQSCMNFSTGSQNQHLEDDVGHGTHVAYLVDHDDDKIERPYARIALKKFEEVFPKGRGQEILRPEHRTYGEAPDSFSHTVNKWVNQHFPGDEDKLYQKNKHVYDDSGNKYVIGKNALNSAVKSKDEGLRLSAAHHPDLTGEQALQLADDENQNVSEKATQHASFTNKHLNHALANGMDRAVASAYSNRKDLITPQVVNKMAASKTPDLARLAVDDKHLTPESLSKLFKHDDKRVRAAAARRQNADPGDIHNAMSDPERIVREAAAGNPSAPSETTTKALYDNEPDVRRMAVNKGWGAKPSARWNRLTPEQLKKAAGDKDHIVKANVADHPNMPVAEHAKLLNDPDTYVKVGAVSSPHTTVNQLTRVIADPTSNPDVIDAALNHPKSTPFMFERMADHPDSTVQWSLANNPKTPRSVLKKILASQHHSAAARALEHDNLTTGDLKDVMENHSSRTVRKKAENAYIRRVSRQA